MLPHGTAQKFGTAIEWLEDAGLVLRCKKVTAAKIPLNAYEDVGSFKLYMHDVGITTLLSEIPLNTVLRFDEADNTFLGALAENYVASCLALEGIPLRYWTRTATAEVDFIFQLDEEVLPLEVKKGLRTKSKSLNVYKTLNKPKQLLRVSAKNFGQTDDLRAIPHYALGYWLKQSHP